MSTQNSVAVLGDTWVLRASNKTETLIRNIGLIVGLTAFTAICAQVSIPLPFTPVPLTLQTFAVLGGAAALGAERAVIAQGLYVGLIWLGLPIAAEHSGGSHVVYGATAGYLVGFIIASYLVGRMAQRGASRNVLDTVAAFVVGSLAIYIVGVSWLSHVTSMTMREAIAAGMIPFLIGDFIKALAAGAVLPSAWNLTKSE